jgi:hypothetical protein
MDRAAAFTFAVVCEAPADLRLVADLADRVLCQEIDWVDSENLALHRQWRGLKPGDSHLEWHWVGRLAQQQNIRAHGHFSGEPGALDATAARKALLLLTRSQQPPDAVVLARDTDGQEERRRGLEQARDASPWPFEVVLAVAHTKREGWVLAGFDPGSKVEEEALAGIRRELGFDPRLQAESLTATEPQAPRNAKRVLNRLISGNPDREQECWTATDLGTLRERGGLSGLATFLDEVRALLIPLFKNPRPSQ